MYGSQPRRLTTRRSLLAIALAVTASPFLVGKAWAATAAEIDSEVDQALRRLPVQNATTGALTRAAVAILIFPKIIKGGLIVGGEYGEGAMRIKGKTTEYYSIAAASFGLQAGGQTFSYALLFMNQGAVDYLRNSGGWAIGAGPSVVVMDEGMAKSVTSTTVTQDVVAVPFGMQGLMAGLGLEGSKITRIEPSR